MKTQRLLTSTEFGEAIGVSVTTLQKWDEKGVLKPFLRTPTGLRKYTQEQVDEYFTKYGNKGES